MLPTFLRAINCYQPAVCLCPQIRINYYSQFIPHHYENSLKSGKNLFELCIPYARKCLLNEWCNTNVAEIWTAQYKPTTINWEGACALGCQAGNICIFENITLMISNANMKLEYTGSRPFLSPPCYKYVCLVAWLQRYRPHITILCSQNLNQKDGAMGAK